MMIIWRATGLPLRLAAPPTACLLHTSSLASSGHNRWSKIRHRKGAADAQRSVQFSRITQEIYLALRTSSPNPSDPSTNPRLAAVLAKAKEIGYPKSNVDAAIQKALNPAEGKGMQGVTYEAIGAGGQVAIVIECLTDNPNRAISSVREKLNKHGARLSSCLFNFERKGRIQGRHDGTGGVGGDSIFERAVEAGAEDVIEDDGGGEGGDHAYEVWTAPTDLNQVASALPGVESAELAYRATTPLNLPGEEDGISEEVAERTANLVAALEEVDDVSHVWTNVKDL